MSRYRLTVAGELGDILVALQSASRLRNFLSWVREAGERAGQGTSALMDSLPLKPGGKYLHVIMIGLDGAGKTTALYMMKLDQYLSKTPNFGSLSPYLPAHAIPCRHGADNRI